MKHCCIDNNGAKLVGAKQLLEILFEESSRPSLRWLREQQAQRKIPFVKLGRLVFFDPPVVREALGAQFTGGRRGLS